MKNNISSKQDTIFNAPQNKKFEFDTNVASVFDDMLSRSIPYYKETIQLCVDFLKMNVKDNERIYDLGCSTGNMLLELHKNIKANLIGLDSSKAMIENATLKAKAYGANIEFLHADCMEVDFLKAKAFIANYTLQFIRPPNRPHLIQKIYNALDKDGIFIMSEKMNTQDSMLEKQMVEYYHAYKIKNGYTTNEISTKREALENILVPYSLEENITLLKQHHFQSVEVLFKWVNFGTIIAKK